MLFPPYVLHALPYGTTIFPHMVVRIMELENIQVSCRQSAPVSFYFGVAVKHKVSPITREFLLVAKRSFKAQPRPCEEFTTVSFVRPACNR